jgi:kumamolisin
MPTPNRLRILLWTSTSLLALLLTIDTGAAQVTLPPGVTLPFGSAVLNPYSSGPLIVSPPSSQEQRLGYSHTNILIPIPQGGFPQFKQNSVGPPFTGYLAETPASLACIYQLGVGGPDAGLGCNPNSVTAVTSGGSKAIAIVDAYDYPTAAADLNVFISQFGLAAATFAVIYAPGNLGPPFTCNTGGTPPPGDGGNGWNVESSLDIEMAHAMAPSAKLYLVEANSNSNADLYNAVQVAAACVGAAGGGQVSNSYGAAEFSGEASNDSIFTAANVVYFASAGDTPGTEYPCVSPNVLCVGGTTISRKGSDGTFESEAVWNNDQDAVGTGGGYSKYEPTPSYQTFISSIVQGSRGAADLAAIADPQTGPWIYNSQTEWTSMHSGQGWAPIGGTSVASPVLAGIFNFANFFYASSFNAVNNIYQLAQAGTLGPYVTHIESGLCGRVSQKGVYPNAFNPGHDPQYIKAETGIAWSPCAGWGTPKDAGNPNWMRARR